MNRTLDGIRCQTARPIAHHRGYLPQRTEGTVRYTIENVGRTLFRVDFDCGDSLLVLPDDLQLDEKSKTN